MKRNFTFLEHLAAFFWTLQQKWGYSSDDKVFPNIIIWFKLGLLGWNLKNHIMATCEVEKCFYKFVKIMKNNRQVCDLGWIKAWQQIYNLVSGLDLKCGWFSLNGLSWDTVCEASDSFSSTESTSPVIINKAQNEENVRKTKWQTHFFGYNKKERELIMIRKILAMNIFPCFLWELQLI